MSSHEGRDRLDRATAEQILRGDPAAPSADHPRLTRLLAAASAPASPAELAGETAAMAAFIAARNSPPSPVRRPSMIQLTVAKLLTAKAAAITCGVAFAGVGGIALAANTGVLPAPISSHLPGVHTSASALPHPVPSGSALPRPGNSVAADRLAELCREFSTRGDRAAQTRALDDLRFGDLVRHAGRKDHDHVARFCARFKPSGTPGARPSGSAAPGGTFPSFPPSTRPDDLFVPRPGEHLGYPSDRPSSFPSGSAFPRPPGVTGP